MGDEVEASKLSDREKSLLDDNVNLKAQLKELETTFNKMQADFSKSIKMREKLDSLCKVLQKQTQEIKDESAAQIGEAEGQGNQLAREVADNISLMEDVNKQLSDIMNESLKAKQENSDLTKEVAELKQKYDERHESLTNDLQVANDDLIKTKTELAQLRLKTAEEREQTFGEMHKLATTLVECRLQMKNAKELELELRQRLQSYDDKFQKLHGSLQDTNLAYTNFTDEMDKVAGVTKALEEETIHWRKKWEVNNQELTDITKKYEKLQLDVAKTHEALLQITNLYQELDKQKKSLLCQLGRYEEPEEKK